MIPHEVDAGYDRPTVLFVDDDAATCELVELALKRLGFEVVTARGQTDALLQFCLRASDFDCVLTDHMLLDGTGFGLSEELRRSGYRGRIVVVSGMLTTADLWSYRGSFISGFFHKPFELSTLATMLLM
jgi:two-component system, NtrC family, response regulator HydG